ncbi:MAG: DUF6491 family protein [Rhodospirillaceae bacterium]
MPYGRIVLGIAALVLAASLARAAEPTAKPVEAQILFANQGGIRDWRALDDKGLYVRGQDGQWYYATLFASCFGLPSTTGIGFVTTPGGGFDKFSAIVVENNKCPVVSLVKSDPPPKK